MSRALFFALLALVVSSAVPADAQTADPALARIDSLVAAGQLAEARTLLEEWIAAHPPGAATAGPGTQAHALFLKGRLATEWRSAEDAYLSVVLGYPTSARAPDALLLLGKGLLAAASTGTPATAALRAASYLERLLNDYPGSPLHAEARLWLARAWEGSGRPADACGLLRRSLDDVVDPDVAGAMRTDLETTCHDAPSRPVADPRTAGDSAAGRAVAPTVAAARADTVAAPPDTATVVRGRFTIQVAAMRSRDGARSVAADLARAGFRARIVDIEGSALIRVRVDTFGTSSEAASLATRIRARGFTAIVVNDVQRERAAR